MWAALHLPPPLYERAVHVWSVRLDVRPERVGQLVGLLSPDERDRAAAFRFAYLQQRYIVAHATLRQLLGQYLAIAPSSVTFRRGPFDKPALDADPHATTVSFNLSHSQGFALIAVTRGYDIGVDVERVRHIKDVDEIARQYFCAAERDTLWSDSGPAKMTRFFRYWTRKEALLKATGDGLSSPLDQVDVSTFVGKQPHAVSVLDSAAVPRQLALVDLEPAPGYLGALATDSTGWRFSAWEWLV